MRTIDQNAENSLLIEALRQELIDKEQQVQWMTSTISHDFREPVRMILSYMELLDKHLSGGPHTEIKEYVYFAYDAARRLQAMLDGLLVYSRVESKGKSLMPVNIRSKFDQVLTELMADTKTVNAQINIGELPEVLADPAQIEILLEELLRNAFKFASDCRLLCIQISGTMEKGLCRIEIQDNGIGFDSRQVERIFKVFQRLHPVDEYPSAGMGLAICKRIIERHGGETGADSIAGEGSTFWFTLPLSDMEL